MSFIMSLIMYFITYYNQIVILYFHQFVLHNILFIIIFILNINFYLIILFYLLIHN